MSILTGPAIVDLVRVTKLHAERSSRPTPPWIDITPFDPELAGPNSYDVHLGAELLAYQLGGVGGIGCLDTRRPNPTVPVPFPADGFVIRPGEFYLAAIAEHVECHGLVPCLETRSSIARLGLSTHLSAGLGDDGAAMRWTLELTAAVPVRIYPGLRIAQMVFHDIRGERKPYVGKYQGADETVASMSWRDTHAARS